MKRRFFIGVFIGLVITGCNGSWSGNAAYTALEEKELKSGKRADDLFFGIKLGMTRKDFFDHCWQMHQKGKFLDGEGSSAVLYKAEKEFKYPASINFYPEFYKDKIYKMWARFEYDAWAPWNKRLFSDSLILNVVQTYKTWYPGNDFISLTDSKNRTIYVKIDGNRRIIIGQFDDAHVKVDYTDLLIERQIKK